MSLRLIKHCFFALAMLLLVAGCGRYDPTVTTAEIDEPTYRRGKDLLKQGRTQEALASFLKVVEKRGDDAPESHLELGILYQQHIGDPIAAIYHYRKFRSIKPNSPQADLVRQRIDAATREFARKLPGQPLENQNDKLDLLEKMDALQRENQQLKEQLIAARTQAVITPRQAPVTPSLTPPVVQPQAPTPVVDVDAGSPSAVNPGESPIVAADPVIDVDAQPSAPPPGNVGATTSPPVARTPPTRPGSSTGAQQPTAPTPAGRRYVVQRGDTLYGIAARHYGQANNARVQAILNANRTVLPNSGALHPGMTLIIPPSP